MPSHPPTHNPRVEGTELLCCYFLCQWKMNCKTPKFLPKHKLCNMRSQKTLGCAKEILTTSESREVPLPRREHTSRSKTPNYAENPRYPHNRNTHHHNHNKYVPHNKVKKEVCFRLWNNNNLTPGTIICLRCLVRLDINIEYHVSTISHSRG